MGFLEYKYWVSWKYPLNISAPSIQYVEATAEIISSCCNNQSHCIVARTINIIEVQVNMWTQLNVLSIIIVELA